MDRLLLAQVASIPPWGLLMKPFGTDMYAVGLIIQLVGIVILVREVFLK